MPVERQPENMVSFNTDSQDPYLYSPSPYIVRLLYSYLTKLSHDRIQEYNLVQTLNCSGLNLANTHEKKKMKPFGNLSLNQFAVILNGLIN